MGNDDLNDQEWHQEDQPLKAPRLHPKFHPIIWKGQLIMDRWG